MKSKYAYKYEGDILYCYPGSHVLKNKLNIYDEKDLQKAEREITSLKEAAIRTFGLKGNFDFNHLCKIHEFLFGEIYDWAGEVRQVDIAKGNYFCHNLFIKSSADSLFNKLKKEKFLKNISQEEIPLRLSFYLSEINVIHPFREGNGRTQRIFIELLAKEIGYSVDFSKISPEEMIEASVESFYCQYEKMDELFKKITTFTNKEAIINKNNIDVGR